MGVIAMEAKLATPERVTSSRRPCRRNPRGERKAPYPNAIEMFRACLFRLRAYFVKWEIRLTAVLVRAICESLA
jgi:hypothetical protein